MSTKIEEEFESIYKFFNSKEKEDVILGIKILLSKYCKREIKRFFQRYRYYDLNNSTLLGIKLRYAVAMDWTSFIHRRKGVVVQLEFDLLWYVDEIGNISETVHQIEYL